MIQTNRRQLVNNSEDMAFEVKFKDFRAQAADYYALMPAVAQGDGPLPSPASATLRLFSFRAFPNSVLPPAFYLSFDAPF